MAPKDFKNAMNRQRAATPALTRNARLGVVSDPATQLRQDLELAAEPVPVKEIALDQLHDNPFQYLARPQINAEGLEELAESIRHNNFYGALLARRQRGTGEYYELAFGHRRRDAARLAGLTVLPVKVMDLSDLEMARIMASENFSREDLTPLNEANVIGYLYTSQNMSVEQIARITGKKRGWVQPRLALYEAPADIKRLVESKPEALSHARLLVQIKDHAARQVLIQAISEHGLTFEQLKAHLEGRSLPEIDNKITTNGIAVDGEINHDASREKTLPARTTGGNISAEAQRLEALMRLDKASARVTKIFGNWSEQPGQPEIALLNKIVDRLNSLLESFEA